jgi:outer membrane receptor for ferrienterochelin and colicins
MKKTFLISLIIIQAVSLWATQYSGKVFEKQDRMDMPLVGVNVYWSGTTYGTSTDAEGRFTIERKNEDEKILVFSFVGYQSDSVIVNEQTSLVIYLKPGKELQEVKVVERTQSTNISRINPILVQQIGNKELNRFACCNLSESFESNAAVDVAYTDAISGVKQIKMLGLSGVYSQMLLENMPILRGGEGAFGLEYIPGTWMQSISVSKGSASVKNGYESMTGQINVQFKEPGGLEKFHLYSYGNQDGRLETNIGYSQQLDSSLNTSLLVHIGKSIRDFDMNHDGFMDKPAGSQVNILNRWEYKKNNISWKSGIGYLYDQRNGGQIGYDHTKTQVEQSRYGIGIDVNRFNVFSKLGFMFDKPNTSLGIITTYSLFDRQSFYGLHSYNATQHNGYFNVIYESFIGSDKNKYNTGISGVFDFMDAKYDKKNIGYNEIVPGAFIEYNYVPSPHLSVLAGLRYDFSSLHGGFVTPRLHAKYHFPAYVTIRGSVGKGYRTANALAGNSNVLASSRTIYFENNNIREDAWNYGLSMVNEIPVAGEDLVLSLDFFRTDFKKQLMVDYDQSVRAVHFYTLQGKSFSNSLQAELSYRLFKQFDITTAWRFNQVEGTLDGKLQTVPFMSRQKGIITASYRTRMEKWQFDATMQFYGRQRIPSTLENDPANQRSLESKPYSILLAQITKNYRFWSFYIGAENLTNFTISNPVIDAQNPFGDQFDASMVWGPVYGRMFYAGIKYILEKKEKR